MKQYKRGRFDDVYEAVRECPLPHINKSNTTAPQSETVDKAVKTKENAEEMKNKATQEMEEVKGAADKHMKAMKETKDTGFKAVHDATGK